MFELDDFKRWHDIVKPDEGNDYLKCVGAGEMLVASAYDFEDFSYPRPDLPKRMEGDLRPVLEFLLENRWPIRFHCTYEESAHRLLSVLEEVGRDKGLEELNWIFDHGETISTKTMDWVARLGGGISYQNRIAFQTNAYRARYGEEALRDVMPVKKMMASGVPLAAGTDATRVSSYNPWLAIHWAVSGPGRGGDQIWSAENRLSRQDALQHWTAAGAWFSRESGKKRSDRSRSAGRHCGAGPGLFHRGRKRHRRHQRGPHLHRRQKSCMPKTASTPSHRHRCQSCPTGLRCQSSARRACRSHRIYPHPSRRGAAKAPPVVLTFHGGKSCSRTPNKRHFRDGAFGSPSIAAQRISFYAAPPYARRSLRRSFRWRRSPLKHLQLYKGQRNAGNRRSQLSPPKSALQRSGTHSAQTKKRSIADVIQC